MYIGLSVVGDVKTPEKRITDAGLDFFIPNDFKETTLKHGDSINIPSGVKVEVPAGWSMIFMDKSGVSSKKGLIIGAKVVDHLYSGIVHINLHKVSGEPITLKPGDKIAQLLLIPSPCFNIVIKEEKELYNDYLSNTVRGEGGFGSTGVN